MLLTGNEKDEQQFDIWCRVNNLNGVKVTDVNDFPNDVYRVDFNAYFQQDVPDECKSVLRFYPTLKSDFFSYLESKMVLQCGSDGVGFPQSIFNRSTEAALRWLIDNDPFECVPNAFVPGPGFDWLLTANYKREPFQLYGEHTTRDYIEDMYKGIYANSIYHPEIHANKNSVDFGIQYSIGVKPVGFVPPKSRSICKTNYVWQCDERDYNVEAKFFFSTQPDVSKFVGEYKMPCINLLGEYKSIARFCPTDTLSCRVDNIKFENFLLAFQYSHNDWGFKQRQFRPLTEAEVISLRTWTSSPGYPYNKHGCTNAQQAYDQFYGLMKFYDKLSKFDWMPTLFNVFCKDELLKLEKVENNDLRTIIAPALCQQLVSQRLTLQLSHDVSNNWRTSHTAIGRTRFYGHVDATASRIGRFPLICEYDITKWDRSIKALLLKLFFTYLWDVIDSDDIHDFWQLANVFESVIYSHMVHRSGEVIRKAYGVPSGFTLTSYANSWIHCFLNVLSFLDLCPDDIPDKLSYMKQNMDFVCYGDDGLMGFTNEVSKWYTLEVRSRWLKEKFSIDLQVPKCKMTDHYFITINHDVDGIVFLGDVIAKHSDYNEYVPYFRISKVINQLVYGGSNKSYTPGELILIAFTHYVECFFHPYADCLRLYLLKLLDKYKYFNVNVSSSDMELLSFLSLDGNALIQKIKELILDIPKFRSFIYQKLYQPQ